MKKLFIALTTAFMFLMTCGFTEGETRVFDMGDLLSESEEEKIQEKCESMAKKTELDIVVLTTKTLGNRTVQQYADDFYDQGKFGYEFEYGSGVLFLISEDPRYGEVCISTAGLGILYIDDDDVEKILDAGWSEFENYNYYDCLLDMMEATQKIVLDFEHWVGVEDVLDKWYAGEYRYADEMVADYNHYGKEKNLGDSIMLSLFISLVVAIIAICAMNSSYKNKMTVDGGTYFRQNSFKMYNNYDNFIRTTVSRVKIESSSSGGGGGGRVGGSSHRSSGGRSHGGGSRRR